MEDFILVKNIFLNTQNYNLSLFGIFDGHGGAHVAEYLKNNFPEVLAKIITENPNKDYSEIINIAIQTIDKDLEKLDNVKECGSTGTIVLIDNDSIFCANVGDSKCFFINDKEAIQMTEDHNCKNKSEVEAIKKKGVKVFDGRVLGCLSLTRTFGDTDFKEFQISCEPYITKISINKDNIKYIVIASDGVWDIVNAEQLFKIQNELKNGSSEEFCNSLIDYSLKGGSYDNISCIVLKFGEQYKI
jgi:protein phosphatase 1L